jgi:NADP-dependent 3-hydroxy acid dehydrogenase YdfG
MPKIVFITGASAGFGEACAWKFAQHGYDLILNGRRSDKLQTLADALENKFNVGVFQSVFDVRDRGAVEKSLQEIPGEWKQVDVLVNNAGLALGREHFEEASLDDWDTMIDTNVKGFLYIAQAVSKWMAARKKGHIINLGSIAGRQVYEKGNVYCATKYAVDALSQSMRIDLLRHGIKVTSINPGAAETEFSIVRFRGDEKTAKSIYDGLKPLTAEDVAEVIYYTTTVPEHVCINDLSLTCLQQADVFYYNRKS